MGQLTKGQGMRTKPMVISLLIIVAIIFGSYKIYAAFHRPLVHHLNEDIQVIGIVNADGNAAVTKESLFNGDDSILLIDHTQLLYQQLLQKIPQTEYFSPDEVFNLNNLHLLDKDGDGQITEKDPIFEHLFILRFYNKGYEEDVQSLSAAGIKAISINSAGQEGGHTITLNDGSKRALYSFSKFEK